jgi:hypothetical protein
MNGPCGHPVRWQAYELERQYLSETFFQGLHLLILIHILASTPGSTQTVLVEVILSLIAFYRIARKAPSFRAGMNSADGSAVL